MDAFYFGIRGIGRVYMFAVMDDRSRFCVACKLFKDKEAVNSLVTVASAVGKYGRPGQLLTDNGREVMAGVFEKYLVKRKIRHIKSRPYTPQSKGKIERFWKTVHRELVTKIEFTSIDHAQKETDRYVRCYNYERRHGGIGWIQPVKRYGRMIKRRT